MKDHAGHQVYGSEDWELVAFVPAPSGWSWRWYDDDAHETEEWGPVPGWIVERHPPTGRHRIVAARLDDEQVVTLDAWLRPGDDGYFLVSYVAGDS